MRRRKLKFKKICSNPYLIGIASLFWFLWRTGTKPTRINYPCQKIARANIAVYGIPALSIGWTRLKKCPRYRKKAILICLSLVLLAVGAMETSRRIRKRNLGRRVLAQTNNRSRVVWVEDARATDGKRWSYYGDERDYNHRANEEIIYQMMDKAILALTEKDNIAGAWLKIFEDHNERNGKGRRDYAAGEIIAIKINLINTEFFERKYLHINHLPQVMNALLNQLVNEKKIGQENIWIYDASYFAEHIPEYKAAVNEKFPGIIFKIDEDGYSEGDNVLGTSLTNILVNCDYLINMPMVKTHERASITLSFKNHLGSVKEATKFHSGFFNLNAETNSLVLLNNYPLIRDKSMLVISDSIYAMLEGPPNYIGPFGIPDIAPNSIFASTDPVAVDSVMRDYILNNSNPDKADQSNIYLQLAAEEGMGVYESSCADQYREPCSFSYNNIDLVRINQTGPTPTPAVIFFKGDVDHSGEVNWQDAVKIVANFGKKSIQVSQYWDPTVDAVVSSFDLGWVVGDWGK